MSMIIYILNAMSYLIKINILVSLVAVLIETQEYKVTDHVFLDIEEDGKYMGRIIIGLFGEVVPKTIQNFKHIAMEGINGKTYEGTRFVRVVDRFMIQGGDIVNNDGSGSISIYGSKFDDENFTVKHSGPGLVSMANNGSHSNGCQFFITTMATPWLDGKHVVFGKVIKGQDVVHKIEHVRRDVRDRPLKPVIIVRSGLMDLPTPYFTKEKDYEVTFWEWIKAGWFPLSFSFAILGVFHYIISQLPD